MRQSTVLPPEAAGAFGPTTAQTPQIAYDLAIRRGMTDDVAGAVSLLTDLVPMMAATPGPGNEDVAKAAGDLRTYRRELDRKTVPDGLRAAGRRVGDVARTPGVPPAVLIAGGEMRAGELLGDRYLLVGELGRGGFGVVWEAYDHRLGRQVAVKTLRHQGPSSATDIRRLRREVEILAPLSHPNIVVVFDLGEAERAGEYFSYLVMELLNGPTLAHVIATEEPDLLRGLDWGQQLCAALGAAHATRVIHRDIKPENVMLVGAGRELVKVLDFGIAQIGDNRDGLTTEGSVVGSTRYLAPERWRGEPGTVRSDLYAVGCVLYELFAGKRPFTSTGQVGLMNQHLDQSPVRPAALPAELADLVLELLAKEPGDRPVDAEEVRRRLAAVAEGVRALRRRADAAWQAAGEGRAADAVGELRTLIPEFARAFGPTDGRTLRTCHDLAVSLERAGEWAEAYCLLAELLPVAVASLGEDHDDVLDIQRRLSRSRAPLSPCPAGLLAALLGPVNRTGA